MLLIPGVALTNSIRDMISGDIMAGMRRFCEACLVSVSYTHLDVYKRQAR